MVGDWVQPLLARAIYANSSAKLSKDLLLSRIEMHKTKFEHPCSANPALARRIVADACHEPSSDYLRVGVWKLLCCMAN